MLEQVIAENTNAIRDLIAALAKGVPTTAAQVAAVVAEAPAEAPAATAKPEKKTTAPKVTAEKPEPTTQMTGAEAEKALDGHANQPKDAPTYQDAADAVTRLARTKGRDAAIAVLKQFDAAKLPDVKPGQFAAVIAACEKAEA